MLAPGCASARLPRGLQLRRITEHWLQGNICMHECTVVLKCSITASSMSAGWSCNATCRHCAVPCLSGVLLLNRPMRLRQLRTTDCIGRHKAKGQLNHSYFGAIVLSREAGCAHTSTACPYCDEIVLIRVAHGYGRYGAQECRAKYACSSNPSLLRQLAIERDQQSSHP